MEGGGVAGVFGGGRGSSWAGVNVVDPDTSPMASSWNVLITNCKGVCLEGSPTRPGMSHYTHSPTDNILPLGPLYTQAFSYTLMGVAVVCM